MVGGFNTVFGYMLFSLVHFLLGAEIGYAGSVVTAHLISSTFAYFLFTRIVFTSGSRGLGAYARFQSSYIVPLVANIVFVPVWLSFMGVNVYVGQAAFALTWVIVSFFVHKKFSFKASSNPRRVGL